MTIEPELTLAEHLKREAGRIYNLIFHSDMEWIDIQIQIDNLRESCRSRAPEKLDLYDAIYVKRFERLWEQWRLAGDTSWTRREPRGGPFAGA